jgi:hypothetical protein
MFFLISGRFSCISTPIYLLFPNDRFIVGVFYEKGIYFSYFSYFSFYRSEKSLLAYFFSLIASIFCCENIVKRCHFYLTLYPCFHIMNAYFAGLLSLQMFFNIILSRFGHSWNHCITRGKSVYLNILLGKVWKELNCFLNNIGRILDSSLL